MSHEQTGNFSKQPNYIKIELILVGKSHFVGFRKSNPLRQTEFATFRNDNATSTPRIYWFASTTNWEIWWGRKPSTRNCSANIFLVSKECDQRHIQTTSMISELFSNCSRTAPLLSSYEYYARIFAEPIPGCWKRPFSWSANIPQSRTKSTSKETDGRRRLLHGSWSEMNQLSRTRPKISWRRGYQLSMFPRVMAGGQAGKDPGGKLLSLRKGIIAPAGLGSGFFGISRDDE